MYVALSGWNSARICDISQEDNSPLTLYIDFQNFLFFLDINSPFDQACTFISALTYLSIKEEGRYIFMKSKILYTFVYSSIRQLYCCDITDIRRVPPKRATYTKLMKPLKIISLDWIIQICPNFCC